MNAFTSFGEEKNLKSNHNTVKEPNVSYNILYNKLKNSANAITTNI